MTHRSSRTAFLAVTLLALLVTGAVVSVSVGQLGVGMRGAVGSMLDAVGIRTSWTPQPELINASLQQIRFPRAAMSVVVGAGLAVAGAVMQATFGNPLAEPGVVGVSSGAALGAAVVIASGTTLGGEWGLALAAFVGGLLTTVVVYLTARSGGRTEVVTLLLTGIAVNAFAGAGIALAMFAGSTASREQIVFFQLGSFNGTRWPEVLVVTLVTVPAVAAAWALGRQYDLLALGERTASHLGVRVERLRGISIVLVALLVGMGVAFVGIVAFVGLVVPHLVRMIVGPAHRALIPLSMLAGATLIVWADTIARTAVDGADLPIGLLTSLIGGPFFLYLIRRSRREAGGWA